MAISRTDTLTIRFQTDGDGKVTASLANVSQGLEKLDAKTSGLSRSMGSLRSVIGGISVAAITAFAVRAIADFERLEARLISYTGSQRAAERVMQQAGEVARATGGNVNELASAWLRLSEGGITPTSAQLQAFSNIAAATGRSLAQVTEAVIDTVNGQSMALRSLGAGVKDNGDTIRVTFAGVTADVRKDGAAILELFERIGNVRFAGAAEREAETLGGVLSDTGTAAKNLAEALGEAGLSAVLKTVAGLFRDAANEAAGFFRWVGRDASPQEELDDRIAELLEMRGEIQRRIDDLLAGKEGLAATQRSAAPDIAALRAELAALEVQLRDAKDWYDQYSGAQSDAADTTAESEEATNQLGESVTKLVAELQREGDTYGKSRSQILEYERAKALAKATTDAERDALNKAYDAAIRNVRAVEQATIAERERVKLDRERERSAREQKRLAEEGARAELQFRDALRALLNELNPLDAKLREIGDQQELLNAAFLNGDLTLEEYNKALLELGVRAEEIRLDKLFGVDSAETARKAREQAHAYVDAWSRELDDLAFTLADVIRAGAEGGFDAAGDVLGRWLEEQAHGNLTEFFREVLEGIFGSDGIAVSDVPGTGGAVQDAVPTGPGGASGDSLITVDNAIAIAGGLYQIYRQSQGQGEGEAALSGAMTGAMYGAQVGGVYGAIIGAVIGAVVGYFSASGDESPSVNVRGNAPFGANDGSARSPFGNVYVREQNTTANGMDLARQISAFDANIARLLTPEQVARVRTAVAGINDSAGSLEEIISRRLNVILRAAVPEWANFLSQFSDIEERLRQFGALKSLKDMLQSLEAAAAEFDSDPAARTQARFAELRRTMTETADALAAAIEMQDPVAIEDAAQRAQAAVTDWARAAIEAATALEQTLMQLDQQSRAFDINIAQRIAQVTGDLSGLVSVLEATRDDLRGRVGSARTPEQGIQYLNEFISTVDQWLAASQNRVQQLLQQTLEALATEEAAIMGDAEARAAQAAASAAAANAAAQAAQQAQIAALQEALRLAQEWLGVLERAEQMLDDLTFGQANPLGAESRFAMLQLEIERLTALMGTQTGEDRAATAARLLELLQQQLGLGQTLFQRPSPESIALFNSIISQINEVADIARPEADRAEELQEAIAALQGQTRDAVYSVRDTLSFLSEEERARLAEIEDERAEAIRAAEEEQARINELAQGYYEWAQGEYNRLEQEQRDILQAQLDALTGGTPLDLFIAQVNAEARDALFNIRDNIGLFLASIGQTGALIDGAGGPGVGGPTIPGGPGNPTDPDSPTVAINLGGVNVTMTGADPAEAARAATMIEQQVLAAINRNATAIASRLKREARTA